MDHRLSGTRILIVDDEADVRDTVCDALALFGARVTAVATAAEAAWLLGGDEVDAVVCDWNLGDERGDAVLAAALDEQPYAARLLLTAAPPLDWRPALDAGLADGAIAKPFYLGELRDAVAGAIAERRRGTGCSDGMRCCQRA
jgi:CheY-like chemotaxis protein